MRVLRRLSGQWHTGCLGIVAYTHVYRKRIGSPKREMRPATLDTTLPSRRTRMSCGGNTAVALPGGRPPSVPQDADGQYRRDFGPSGPVDALDERVGFRRLLLANSDFAAVRPSERTRTRRCTRAVLTPRARSRGVPPLHCPPMQVPATGPLVRAFEVCRSAHRRVVVGARRSRGRPRADATLPLCARARCPRLSEHCRDGYLAEAWRADQAQSAPDAFAAWFEPGGAQAATMGGHSRQARTYQRRASRLQ